MRIDDVDRKAVYLSEGLGHAIVALEDRSTVNYLVSAHYDPQREKGITLLDPTVGGIPEGLGEPVLPRRTPRRRRSSRLPSRGLLPTYEEALAYTESLRTKK